MTAALLALVAVTLASRVLPRLLRPAARNSDTFYHLASAECIRANRFRIPFRNEKFVLPGRYVYPSAYHHLVALLPRRRWLALESVTSAVFDTVLVVVFVLAAHRALAAHLSMTSLALLGMAFALAPALTGVGIGPRAYQGTPRTLAELLVTIFFLAMWRHWLVDSAGWAAVTVVMGAFALNTNKFSGQVIVLFTASMAGLLWSWRPLAFAVAAFAAAVVISGGHVARSVRYQLGHLRLYRSTLSRAHPATLVRRSWRLPRSARDVARFFLFDSPIGIALSRFGVLIAAAVLLPGPSVLAPASEAFLVAWFMAAVAVFAVVLLPQFAYIGEAERYLEHALVPAFILLVAHLPPRSLPAALTGLIAAHAALYGMNVFVFVRHQFPVREDGMSAVIGFLNTLSPTTLVSLLGMAPWELAFRTHHRLAFTESLVSPFYDHAAFTELFIEYPVPVPNFDLFAQRHGVEVVVASKAVLSRWSERGVDYPVEGLEVLFEDDKHVVYALNPVPGRSAVRAPG